MSNMNIKTSAGRQFHSSGSADKKQALFAVSEGIPLIDALESASILLSTTEDSLFDAGMQDEALEGNSAWLVYNTLLSAKAVIDSLVDSARGQEFAQSLSNITMQQLETLAIHDRDGLSFTKRDDKGRMINWPENNPGVASDADKGRAFFDEEIASLACSSEREAYKAIQFAIMGMGGHYTCLESGFAEAVARAAVLGLRAIKGGAPSLDNEAMAAGSAGASEFEGGAK